MNKFSNEEFTVANLKWQVVSQSFSNIAWYFIEDYDLKSALNLLQGLDSQTQLSKSKFSIAILDARKGIAFYYLKRYPECASFLKESYYLFEKVKDFRGQAWVASYLGRCYVEDSSVLSKIEFEQFINATLKINEDADLFDLKYFESLNIFLDYFKNLKNNEICDKIKNEIQRLKVRVDECSKVSEEEDYIKLVNVISKSKTKTLSAHDLLDRFLRISTIKIGSDYIRSFINQAKKNYVEVFEFIFSTYTPEEIFTNPFYNKLITEASKLYPDGLDKYVIPELDFIRNNTIDSIRIHYARALEYANRADFAIFLLDSVKVKSSQYYNIYGNCIKFKDRYLSYKYYYLAIETATRKDELGRYYNNIAWLIYNTKWSEKYEEAIQACQTSLINRKFHSHLWPYSLHCLCLIKIEMTGSPNIVDVVNQIKDEYRLSPKFFKDILPKIRDNLKRNILLSALKLE